MSGGFGAVRTALSGMDGGTPTEVFNAAAKSFLNAVGARVRHMPISPEAVLQAINKKA
jgi:hypothetical protein